MDGEEILNLLESDTYSSKIEHGVYSADTIPAITQYPTGYIVNTDDSDLPGQHWVSFYFEHPKKMAEYFDSYGLPPIRQTFLEILPDKYKYCTTAIQGLNSITCGEYCVYFLQQRSRKKSIEEIISTFSEDTEWNDKKVQNYVKQSKNYVENRNYLCNKQCCVSKYMCTYNTVR